MKTYYITGEFPQALAKHTFQAITVQASSFHTAVKKGVRAFLARPGIKGKRHLTCRIQITVDRGADRSEGT